MAGEAGGGERDPGSSPFLRERLYGGLAEVAWAASPALSLVRPSLAAEVAERRTAADALAAWAREGRDPGRPLVWVHGASAGELLGAVPVVEALRAGVGAEADAYGAAGGERPGTGGRRDPLQVVVTHTSPSGAAAAEALAPDWSGFPPPDAPRPCRRAVEAVRPDALVFAKGDVWPGLVRAAAAAGVPAGLVNGTVRPGSSRLKPPVRWALRPAYARLRRAGAVSGEDADRLRSLGVPEGAVRITGDAAFDLALARADRPDAEGRAARARLADHSREGVPLLVAGSTWPEDEALLLAAAARLEERGLRLDLVLVPHRPTEAAVSSLETRVRETSGREPVRWSAPDLPAGRPLIVDAVGILADLYGAADLAYVGGGLGDDGLHSVVEPAAAGAPVLFGPRHERREAAELLARGGARELSPGRAVAVLEALAGDPDRRTEMGRRARAYVEAGAGAAEAGAALVRELIGSR